MVFRSGILRCPSPSRELRLRACGFGRLQLRVQHGLRRAQGLVVDFKDLRALVVHGVADALLGGAVNVAQG